MDRRKNLQQLLGQGTLDGYARSREPVRADVDAWYQVSLGDGKVRAIGVSNFMVEYLTTLLQRTSVVSAVNQSEVHLYFQQRQAQTLGAEHGILTQA